MLLSATSQFQFGRCICSHFIVAGNFKQSCNSKSNKGKSLKKKLQHGDCTSTSAATWPKFFMFKSSNDLYSSSNF